MGVGTSGIVAEALHLGNCFLGVCCALFVCLSDIPCLCLLAGLTMAMEMPISGEKPAPVGVDFARVRLHAPPKASL